MHGWVLATHPETADASLDSSTGSMDAFVARFLFAFYVRVQSRAALKNKSFVLEPRGSRRVGCLIGRERALPWCRGAL